MSKISTDEWLSELERVSSRQDEGLTALEWAEKLGLSVKSVRVRLGAANQRGWLKVGRRTTRAIDGTPYQVPVYLVQTPKSGGRK